MKIQYAFVPDEVVWDVVEDDAPGHGVEIELTPDEVARWRQTAADYRAMQMELASRYAAAEASE
jgi:hypothetical protein